MYILQKNVWAYPYQAIYLNNVRATALEPWSHPFLVIAFSLIERYQPLYIVYFPGLGLQIVFDADVLRTQRPGASSASENNRSCATGGFALRSR